MNNTEILIHVRFAANGVVTEIGERPDAAPAQRWFDFLTTQVGENFQPLSGGRGIFRVDPAEVARIKAAFATC